MSFEFTREELDGMNDAQKDALIDVLIAGLCADGSLKQHELDRLDEELRDMSWGRSDAVTEQAIKASYAKIRSFTAPEQAVAMVKNVAATITDRSLREKAFAMLARILYDGVEMTPNEQTVLTAFVVAFEIPLPRIKEIGEAVKSGH